jgi:GNAT superfamily N-acetyltransferase
MHVALPETVTRPATLEDTALVYTLYRQTPRYFDIISIPVPTLEEVQRELEAAASDPRRRVELILAPLADQAEGRFVDEQSGHAVVGYLDYKLAYPEAGDATVNLLLIPEPLQRRGYGKRCARDLEQRLRGQVKRLLASIYGRNPGATRFWSSLGYHFAIDARPVLDWYAKELL